MDDSEPPIWTLEEHLVAGEVALHLIDADCLYNAPEPVCHHFGEAVPVDPMAVSREAHYDHLRERFTGLGLEFLADRLEAWEKTRPDQQWLITRIPAMFETANQSGLHYQGWTWEPRDRQPIGASDMQVINNRTA